MRKVFMAVYLALAGTAPVALGQDKAETRKEKIWKTFVEEFVPLTPGKGKFPASFLMGSMRAAEEQPVHKVTFSYSFAMAKYEVTQELYEVIMGKNPSRWKGPRNSVEMITWDEAVTFCQKVTVELRRRELLAKDQEIRLPSEAEWEFACRAGTATLFSFGDDKTVLTHYAWFTGNAKGNDPPVGAKKPNPWGLYDMHGYVWEWCADSWHPDYKDAPADGSPRQAKEAKERMLRGGAWTRQADACRSAFRFHRPVQAKGPDIGFRCVRATIKKGG